MRASGPASRPAGKTSARAAPGRAHPLAILIAARPALYREILSRQLASEPDLGIAGQARDEETILAVLSKKSPTVLLLDYEGFGPNTESLIPKLRRASPSTRILLLATRSDDETAERMLRIGAVGLVAKQRGFEVLVRAIRAVARGELWAERHVTSRAIERLVDSSPRDAFAERLTAREFEIAEAVGRGLRNKEIARRLQIKEKTVKSHLNNIFRKLHVDNRFAVGLYVLKLPPLAPGSSPPPDTES